MTFGRHSAKLTMLIASFLPDFSSSLRLILTVLYLIASFNSNSRLVQGARQIDLGQLRRTKREKASQTNGIRRNGDSFRCVLIFPDRCFFTEVFRIQFFFFEMLSLGAFLGHLLTWYVCGPRTYSLAAAWFLEPGKDLKTNPSMMDTLGNPSWDRYCTGIAPAPWV